MSGEFVDSNVLLYAHDSGAGPKRVRAATLLERLGDERRGLVSSQALMEFYVAATRKLPGRLDHRTAAAIVRDFGTWPAFLPGVGDILEGARLARHALSRNAHRPLRENWFEELKRLVPAR